MLISLEDVSPVAAAAWERVRDEMLRLLDDELVALWGHGSMVHPDAPRIIRDLDVHAVVARPLDERTWEALDAALGAIGHEMGIDLVDVAYTLASEAGGSHPPRDARRPDGNRRHVTWATERAHWLAGAYVHLHGPRPEEFLRVPARDELDYALGRELEHLERHVIEGPHNAYEGYTAILNGSRILHARATGDSALSKRAGGTWALAHLAEEWHPAISAALRVYDGRANDDEVQMLIASMGPFVAMVRERMPLLPDRAPGSPPRWSV